MTEREETSELLVDIRNELFLCSGHEQGRMKCEQQVLFFFILNIHSGIHKRLRCSG